MAQCPHSDLAAIDVHENIDDYLPTKRPRHSVITDVVGLSAGKNLPFQSDRITLITSADCNDDLVGKDTEQHTSHVPA